MGEGAQRPEARCHPDWAGVDAAGRWSESHVSSPGRPVHLPERLATPRGVARGAQESAEAIVAISHDGEGPNTRSRTDTRRSMRDGDADQRTGMSERARRAGGGTAEGTGTARQACAARREQVRDGAPMLMEEVVRRGNVVAAYKRVVRNKGAPGVDGLSVDDLKLYCAEHWTRVRKELLSGTYRPQPVRRVMIP